MATLYGHGQAAALPLSELSPAFLMACQRLRSAYREALQRSTTEAEQRSWSEQSIRLRRFFARAEHDDQQTIGGWMSVVRAETVRVTAYIDAQIARCIA